MISEVTPLPKLNTGLLSDDSSRNLRTALSSRIRRSIPAQLMTKYLAAESIPSYEYIYGELDKYLYHPNSQSCDDDEDDEDIDVVDKTYFKRAMVPTPIPPSVASPG